MAGEPILGALLSATDASQAMPGQSASPVRSVPATAACPIAPNATARRELKGSAFAGLT